MCVDMYNLIRVQFFPKTYKLYNLDDIVGFFDQINHYIFEGNIRV